MEPTVLQVDRLDERHLPRDFGEYLKRISHTARHARGTWTNPLRCGIFKINCKGKKKKKIFHLAYLNIMEWKEEGRNRRFQSGGKKGSEQSNCLRLGPIKVGIRVESTVIDKHQVESTWVKLYERLMFLSTRRMIQTHNQRTVQCLTKPPLTIDWTRDKRGDNFWPTTSRLFDAVTTSERHIFF